MSFKSKEGMSYSYSYGAFYGAKLYTSYGQRSYAILVDVDKWRRMSQKERENWQANAYARAEQAHGIVRGRG